ncbi:threonine/serine exporter family protein [Massilibacteroides sp.]|uniref:threonine/serine ThrE exporter family protein n=1 Tax=Massilibacteroides sp. TaxID=2034766 RepID=UPI00262B5D56|nr:threonine/serine exporter family protein [Massilibacteroides sp.]MDD4516271.1 threonine/serine exporter family protein [Massilibacteroides sp.]
MDYTSLEYKKLDHIATLAVDVGTFLLACGAHCGRISRNLNRIVNTWGVNIHMNISYTGVLVTACYDEYPEMPVTIYKRSPVHGVNFTAINEISQLSWLVETEKISVDETIALFMQIKNKRAYPKSVLLVGIGISCACLCIVAGGDWRDAIVAFVASIAGMLVRLEIVRHNYNLMISFTAAAFVTSLITALNVIGVFQPLWGESLAPDRALATAVLYLVPGVPLTNCIIDLIEGYIPSAIARGVFGAFILLCIAAGMSMSIILFGIEKF